MSVDAVLAGDARWVVLTGRWQDVLPDGLRVDHVITDPPYTQRTSENMRSRKDPSDGGAYIGDSHRRRIEFDGIDGTEEDLVSLCVRSASRWSVVFCALEQIGTYANAAGANWVRASAWLRDNPAPQFTGDRPGQAHEGLAIMHAKGRKRWNRGGHVYAPKGPTINAVRDPQRGKLGHPTPKPEWLMLDMVEAFTDPGDIVLDPYCGSGTTGVACLRLGRRFIGCEMSSEYAQIARDRLTAEETDSTLTALRAGQVPLFGGK